MKKNREEEIDKMTWRELLSHFDFSIWGGFSGYIDCEGKLHNGDYFIKRYTTKDFLNELNAPYDAEKHILYWGSPPTEIIDWDTELKFYIVYVWIDEEKVYEGWTSCFFSKEEAENFIKEMQDD